MKPGISIIIPVFRSASTLERLVDAITNVFSSEDPNWEILLVEDGSGDGSWERICALARQVPALRGIRLSRNFGQQNALCCGFAEAKFETVVTMDDDLQHMPEEIPTLLYALEHNNFDVVYGISEKRYHAWYRNIGSRFLNMIFKYALGKPAGIGISSFRALRGDIAQKISAEARGFVYISAATFRLTQNAGNINTGHARREDGKSNYTLNRLIKIVVRLLVYYTDIPLMHLFRSNSPIFKIAERTPPRLLFAGAGSCQLNAIKKARDRGISVVTADYLPDAPGKQFSDFTDSASTFDFEGVMAAAIRYRVDGIFTIGTDQPVMTCARVAERLGLFSFLTPSEAAGLTDKRQMKEILSAAEIPTVPYVYLRNTNDCALPFGFPIVIKPLDSQGQRGVFKCRDRQELELLFSQSLAYSRIDMLLAEAYYDSSEITVSGWVENGRLTILTVTDRLTFEAPPVIGISSGHHFPTRHLPTHANEIDRLSRKIVDAFRIRRGPVYIQLLVGSKGLLVNEVAGRMGGAYEDMFIPLLTGLDPLSWSLDAVLNKHYDVGGLADHDFRSYTDIASMELFFARPGEVSILSSFDLLKEKLPFIEFGRHHFHPGSVIPSIENAAQRAGYAFFRASNEEQLRDRRRSFYNALEILDQNGQNLVIKPPDIS